MSGKKERRKNGLPAKICGLLLGLCLIAGMNAGVVYADEGEEIRSLLNGSFEDGQSWEGNYQQPNQDNVPYWNTTATDKRIELFRENTNFYINNNVTLKPPKGKYAAELNAEEESTLYQNVKTTPSSVYKWGLDHGARNGTDTMALVIGPKQSVDPAKPSKNGRDQFMQMIDWLIEQGLTSVKDSEGAGLGEQLTVYSKKFAEGGTFADNADGNAFSLTPSSIYTEEWRIWIMASNRATSGTNPWNSYGSNGDSDSGGALDLSKYYLYTVPAGQTDTIFGFVSVGVKNSTASSGKEKTYGNFVDDINFVLYHPLSGSTTTHGSVIISSSDGSTGGSGSSTGHPVSVGGNYTTYITDGETLKIQAIVKKHDGDAGCEFVGAYYTKQTGGNPVTDFLKLSGNEIEDTGSLTEEQKDGKWIKSINDEGDIIYTYYLKKLTAPVGLHFVFIKNPTITYDANGGKTYFVDRTYNDDEAENVYSFKPASGTSSPDFGTDLTFISPYVSHAAEAKNDSDDWKFMGWLLTGDTVDDIPSDVHPVNPYKLGSLVLPAIHTVACDYSSGASGSAQYFKIYDGGSVPLTKTAAGSGTGVVWADDGAEKAYANVHKGLTMVAQWRWRQAFIPQLKSGNDYTASDQGGTVAITSVTNLSDTNYEAAYSLNGGKSYFAETNETVTAVATANPGFTFEGWYDPEGNLLAINAEYSYTVSKESVRTCYARFSGSVTQTFIRQFKNSGTLEEATDSIGTLTRYSYIDAPGKPISSQAIAKEGYKFDGWYDSGGALVTGSTNLSYTTTGNATYYARFSEKLDRPANAQVNASGGSSSYDGTAHTITVTGANLSGDTVYYSTNNGTSWSTTKPTRTNVGTTAI